MSTLDSSFLRGSRALVFLLAAFVPRAARAEVVSLTIGIDSRCPYGLVA